MIPSTPTPPLDQVPVDPSSWEQATPRPKTPRQRTARTVIQVIVAVVVALPVALIAVEQAGLDVPDRWVAIVTGLVAGFTVLVSAGQNAFDSRSGRG